MFAFQGLSLVFGWFCGVAPFCYNFHSASYIIELDKGNSRRTCLVYIFPQPKTIPYGVFMQ